MFIIMGFFQMDNVNDSFQWQSFDHGFTFLIHLSHGKGFLLLGILFLKESLNRSRLKAEFGTSL